jgi:hypothetical protein
MAYSKNVFINCPFDNDYYPLLKSALFTVVVCGFEPLISETPDADSIRIKNIKYLIEEAKYSIHDLSRVEPTKKKKLPRFNMPFELGIDVGCKEYLKKDKIFLILSNKPYEDKQYISDISGQDISYHENDQEIVIKSIRDWFQKINKTKTYPNYKQIFSKYVEFTWHFTTTLKNNHMDPYHIWEIPFSEYIKIVKDWYRLNKF